MVTTHGTVYYDSKGNLYAIMKDRWGLYKAHRATPGSTRWIGVAILPVRPRATAAEAQADLDELARRAGWKVQP